MNLPMSSSHQSAGEAEVSVVAQNKDCYESGIVCMKTLVIHVGLTKIYFTDNSGNPVRPPGTVTDRPVGLSACKTCPCVS